MTGGETGIGRMVELAVMGKEGKGEEQYRGHCCVSCKCM